MRTGVFVGPAIAGLVLASGSALIAQAPAPPPPATLASAQALNCSFSSYTVGGWKDGAPYAVTASDDLAFTITIIKARKGPRAQITGPGGAIEATLVSTPTGLNVIEQTPQGNFTLTTVFTGSGVDGRFLAVHSRHVDLGKGASPQQHYGTCQIAK